MRKPTLPSLLILTFASVASFGGTGKGTSTSVTLDTTPPEITILGPAGGGVYAVEDTIPFVWSVHEDNAAVSDLNRRATGFANGAPFESVHFSAAAEQAWDWTTHMVSSTECRLEVYAKDGFGNEATAVGETFAIYAPASPVPDPIRGFALSPPSPNPFNPRTLVSFDLEAPGRASVAVFDLQGRLVKILCSGTFPAGRHDVLWRGTDVQGRRAAGGPYLVRLAVAGRGVLTRKVVLIQ